MKIDRNLILEIIGNPLEADFVVVALIFKPELRDRDLFKDVSFEHLVILRKKVIDYKPNIDYKTNASPTEAEIHEGKQQLMKLMDSLVINRVKRLKEKY
jgi:uncharacterized protein with HEPN domain